MMLGDPALLEDVAELEQRGDLRLRCVLPLLLEPDTGDEQIEALLALRDRRGRRWRAGAAKFFIDGVIDTGTAWLFEAGPHGEGIEPFWPDPGRYAEVVARFARAGFQCATHAIGDRAVATALDAYRDAGARGQRAASDRAHRDAARRGARALRSRGRRRLDAAAARRPPRRARSVPLARQPAARAGRGRLPLGRHPSQRRDPRTRLGLAGGQRGPAHRPRLGAAAPRARETRARAVHPGPGADGRRGARGLHARGGPRARRGALNGRIAAGMRADFTGLGADPLVCPPDELPDVPVRLTVVDGEVVFRA